MEPNVRYKVIKCFNGTNYANACDLKCTLGPRLDERTKFDVKLKF